MNLKIRPAILEDHPILLEFEQGIVEAERPFDPTLKDGLIHYYNLKEYITSNETEIYVAEIDDKVVASGFVRIEDEDDFRKHNQYAYLGFMYVLPEYRGKGINKKILDALLKWAKNKNLTEVLLEVYDGNDNAFKAYEKAGFKKRMVEMRLEI